MSCAISGACYFYTYQTSGKCPGMCVSDRMHQMEKTSSFPIGLIKTGSDFIVRSVATGLGRWTWVVAWMLIFF